MERKLKTGIKMDTSNNQPYRTRTVNGKTRKIYLTYYPLPSKTKSDFAQDCDVNRIMLNYRKNGIPPNKLKTDGVFGDFSNLPNFNQSLDIVTQANSEFNELNSKTRNYFNNNPQQLFDFIEKPENKDKAIELGLIDKPPYKSTRGSESAEATSPETTEPEPAPTPESTVPS